MPRISLTIRKNKPRTQNKKVYQEIYGDRRWRMLRDWKLKENPVCERCMNMGKTTPADAAHHIIPFDRGKTPEEVETLAYDADNLMSVCNSCHAEIHKKLKGF